MHVEKAKRKRALVIWRQTCTFHLKIKLVTSFRHERLFMAWAPSPLFYSHSNFSWRLPYIRFLCACFSTSCCFSFVKFSALCPHHHFTRLFTSRSFNSDRYTFIFYEHAFLAHSSKLPCSSFSRAYSFSLSVCHSFFVWMEKCIGAI